MVETGKFKIGESTIVNEPIKKIPLTEPYYAPRMHRYLSEVMDSGWWTEGPMVERFERMVAEKVGAKYAIAVPNATIGLEMVLKVEGILEDINVKSISLPAYTHPATALAIIRAGYGLFFVDIDKYSGLVPYSYINCLGGQEIVMSHIPVSLFGNSAGIIGAIVEDAACSLGTEGVGKDHTCVFSFHPRKIISTGEGGMITTNNEGLAQELREHKNFGPGGSNFKMSDFTAAIGVAQMEVLDKILESRRELAQRYDDKLSPLAPIDWIRFLSSYAKGSNYQSYIIIVDNRDEVIRRMADVGIETQIGSYNLTSLEEFGVSDYKTRFPGADFADRHYLTLPLYPFMSEKDQDYVVDNLRTILNGMKNRQREW